MSKDKIQIYLAGGMSGFLDDYTKARKWRKDFNRLLNQYTDNNSNVVIIDPNDFFNFEEQLHNSEREVKQFDLRLVKSSDLIVVNFNDPRSIGTAQELAIAHQLDIPILGLNEAHHKLHPWIEDDCDRIFDNMNELVEYVYDYYCYMI